MTDGDRGDAGDAAPSDDEPADAPDGTPSDDAATLRDRRRRRSRRPERGTHHTTTADPAVSLRPDART